MRGKPSCGVEKKHRDQRQHDKTARVDQPGLSHREHFSQIAFRDHHPDDQHRRRSDHTPEPAHSRHQNLRDADSGQHQRHRDQDREHIRVKQQLCRAEPSSADKKRLPVAPGQQIEQDLYRAAVEDPVVAQCQLHQRHDQIPAVHVDQRRLINGVDPSGPPEQSRDQNKQSENQSGNRHRREESDLLLRRDVPLERLQNQARRQHIRRQLRQRSRVRAFQKMHPHDAESRHNHQHHRDQILHERQTHCHRFSAPLRLWPLPASGFGPVSPSNRLPYRRCLLPAPFRRPQSVLRLLRLQPFTSSNTFVTASSGAGVASETMTFTTIASTNAGRSS